MPHAPAWPLQRSAAPTKDKIGEMVGVRRGQQNSAPPLRTPLYHMRSGLPEEQCQGLH